jgi:enterochelin esterase-like enzyme
MKRLVSILLIAILILSGCGKVDDQTSKTNSTQQESKKDETTEKELVSEENKEIDEESTAETETAETETAETETEEQQYLIYDKFDSLALAKNIVNEPTEKDFCILLPPSYYDGNKRYPVVYYLHGQAESALDFMVNYEKAFLSDFENGAKEFILVGVNGTSNQGGAFYVNSPVSGYYEDYVVDELVSYIDENYRTIANRDSRGICGFSMGGFGAYNLAFRHPDVYCCVLAMSPGALAKGELPIAMEGWKGDTGFLVGYARAFSPLMEDETKTYGSIPTMDDTEEDKKIQKDWESGFGNIAEKLDAYIKLNNPLKAIKITYGSLDLYKWIPSGCEYMADCMDQRGISYTMEVVKTGHSLPSKPDKNYIIPFFEENLCFE